jgi:hypothetical protein
MKHFRPKFRCDSELCSLHTSDWCQGSLEVPESFHVAFSSLSRYGISSLLPLPSHVTVSLTWGLLISPLHVVTTARFALQNLQVSHDHPSDTVADPSQLPARTRSLWLLLVIFNSLSSVFCLLSLSTVYRLLLSPFANIEHNNCHFWQPWIPSGKMP